jgi:prevent-host-death family protein
LRSGITRFGRIRADPISTTWLSYVRFHVMTKKQTGITLQNKTRVVTLLHAIFREYAMTITTISSREFNQDISRAKYAAKAGPVFITDRGKPAHVLLSIEDYQQITHSHQKIADLLALPGIEDAQLDTPNIGDLPQPANFS